MARESAPPTPSARKVKWGAKTTTGKQTYLENPEEYIRLAEGTVDKDGIRHIEMEKEGDKYDNPRLRHYRSMGYEFTDETHYYRLSIPQAQFLALEKKRQENDLKTIRTKVRDEDFDKDEDVILAPVSAADVLAA